MPDGAWEGGKEPRLCYYVCGDVSARGKEHHHHTSEQHSTVRYGTRALEALHAYALTVHYRCRLLWQSRIVRYGSLIHSQTIYIDLPTELGYILYYSAQARFS